MPNVTMKATSPLAASYLHQESEWRSFVARRYPGARLIKWGTIHRVYHAGDRLLKIQCGATDLIPVEQTVENECRLLQAVEGAAWTLNPVLHREPGNWRVLEMDWIEGDLASDLMAAGDTARLPILRIVRALVAVSLRGVVHHQFRPRHILIGRQNSVHFIDFGGSRRVSSGAALGQNLSMLRRGAAGWRWTSLAWLLKSYAASAIGHRFGMRQHAGTIDRSNRGQDWLSGWHRDAARKGKPESRQSNARVFKKPWSSYLERTERCVDAALKIQPEIARDILTFQVDRYILRGMDDWGLVWGHIISALEFSRKTVLDVGCAFGLASVLCSLEGADRVVAVEENEFLLEGARSFANAFGVNNVDFRRQSLSGFDAATIDAGAVDILLSLSTRAAISRKFVTSFRQAVYRTATPFAEEQQQLMVQGVASVQKLSSLNDGTVIIHAARNR